MNEMVRVLKPGGKLAVATWCQREETATHPLTTDDKANLQVTSPAIAPTAMPYGKATRELSPGGWGRRCTDATRNGVLQFLYDEWAHPHFISFEEYARIMDRTGVMADITVRVPRVPPGPPARRFSGDWVSGERDGCLWGAWYIL